MTRVLLVEDNAELAENLIEILGAEGQEAIWVETAEEALAAVREEAFAGILTDLRLPGISGLEMLAQLRRTGDATPLVLMTAYADARATQEAEELGALDVMFKPVDLAQLASVVGEFSNPDPCVLLVDDNRELADNLAEALGQHGFHTTVVGSVEQALALRKLPKVALVDLRLPDGNGISVAQRLAARDPRVAVILMSGFLQDLNDRDMPHQMQSMKRALPKPVRVEDVVQAVEDAVASTVKGASGA